MLNAGEDGAPVRGWRRGDRCGAARDGAGEVGGAGEGIAARGSVWRYHGRRGRGWGWSPGAAGGSGIMADMR
jgi:hypothetical protein